METLHKYIKNNTGTKAYLLVGIPGSGKSTWCKKNHPNLPVVSRDIIRAELGYTKNADEKAVLSRDKERKVTTAEYDKISELCEAGKSFIIDDTNTSKYRKDMIAHLKKNGTYIIGVNFTTPLKTCIERRKGQIPEEVMHNIYDKKVDLKKDEVDEIINV